VEPLVEVVARAPAPALSAFVARYVGYRLEGAPPRVHRGLPSRHLTFIVSLAEPIDILRMPAAKQSPAALQAFVGGLHTSAARIRTASVQHGISVDLRPFGARALLGLPAAELTATVVALDDLLGPAGRELPERLQACASWPERFAALDALLARALDARRLAPPWVLQAWQRLTESAGAPDVGGLARELGWSRRHFTEGFHREIGLPPRQLARVLRFERSRALLARPDRPPLAEAAVACGCYDQAHLYREWRDLAGCTPTQWLAEELPSVQDELEVGAAP
jgi:AraC-like DNA-binding protein